MVQIGKCLIWSNKALVAKISIVLNMIEWLKYLKWIILLNGWNGQISEMAEMIKLAYLVKRQWNEIFDIDKTTIIVGLVKILL